MNFFLNRELSVALQGAVKAAKEVSKIYNTDFSVQWKKKDDPLTEADLLANQIISDIINSQFPNDSILSEESLDSKQRLSNSRVWILDPIDGTREFVTKNPEFAISLGLSVDGDAVLGIILNPATRELFIGAKEIGLSESILDHEFSLPDIESLKFTKSIVPTKKHCIVSNSETRDGMFEDPFWKNVVTTTAVGSIAYKLGLVAVGKAGLTISCRPKNEWDICGGIGLLNSVGYTVLELSTLQPFKFNSTTEIKGLIAGSPEIVNELLLNHNHFLKNSYKDRD